MQQAQATQEANRAASNRWPPFWAILAMLVLGWNEFLAVLYNPLWLLAAVLIFLFGKTVYEARPPSHLCCRRPNPWRLRMHAALWHSQASAPVAWGPPPVAGVE